MTTVFTVDGVTKLIYTVLEKDYGVPKPTGSGSLGTITTGGTSSGLTQTQIQTLIDTAIAGIPQSAGVTLQQVEASIAAAVSNLPASGLDEPAVVTLLEQKLTEFAPMIQQAIQSQFNAMPDRIRLNTTGASAAIEVLNLTANPTTGAQNVSGLDIEAEQLTVNGRRVLTVDDAIDPAGVDQAAVEAATAPLLERITALEAALAKKADLTYVGEQHQALTDLHNNDMSQVGQALDDLSQHMQATDNEIVQFTLDTYATKATVQSVLDAMNGPGATPESVTQMFWLLNDIIVSLAEATGVELPEGGK